MLDALPAHEFKQIESDLNVVDLTLAKITQSPGDRYPSGVLFPMDAVLSVVASLGDGQQCEVGTIGREGASGMEIALGDSVRRSTICQVRGRAAHMSGTNFARHTANLPSLRDLVTRVTEARLFFVEQQCACNAVHSIAQRTARWLLTVGDRVGSADFELTHEFLSIMLGVRRATVTRAALALRGAGAIRYRHGYVSIGNRGLLLEAACECYAATTAIFDASLQPGAAAGNGLAG